MAKPRRAGRKHWGWSLLVTILATGSMTTLLAKIDSAGWDWKKDPWKVATVIANGAIVWVLQRDKELSQESESGESPTEPESL